jgi:hypothetical protein
MTSRQIASFVLAAAAVAWPGLSAKSAETKRTVYLSVTDARGAPVTDLTAADLAVKEDGKDRVIVSLEPATAPMDVAILVDDNGSGGYQAGVFQFIQALTGHAKFSISQFTPQVSKIVDYTDEVPALQAALERLGRRGKIDGEGDQLVEAIDSTARGLLQRKSVRPVILVLTISGGGQAKDQDLVMKQLAASGSVLCAIFLSASDIGQVIGDGPKQTGGIIERIGGGNGIPPAITKITDLLMHQYVLTYTLPDGVKPNEKFSVSTKRNGVSLIAPTRIPNK